METRALIKFFFPLQGKAPKEIHAILTEILACFLLGRAKELSALLYNQLQRIIFLFQSVRIRNFIWDVFSYAEFSFDVENRRFD